MFDFAEIEFKFEYEGHRVKIKVTGAKSRKSLFPQCTTSIGHDSGFIKQSYEVCSLHGVF